MKLKYDILNTDDLSSEKYTSILKDMYNFSGRQYCNERPVRTLVKGKGNFRILDMEPAKHWEYPYAVINSELKEGMKIADCGAGKGLLQFYLAKLGCSVVSVDEKTFHSRKLEKIYNILNNIGIPVKKDPTYFINRSAKKLKVNVSFHNRSILDMELDTESYDRVYCISVIEHIPIQFRAKALLKMWGILKPEGKMILTIDFSMKSNQDSLDSNDVKELLRTIDNDFEFTPNFHFDDWDKYLKDVNTTFGSNLDYTSLGVVIEK